MKIITVLVGNIYYFPPAISILKSFEKIGLDSVLISTRPSGNLNSDFRSTKIGLLNIDYEAINSPVKKLLNIPIWRKKLWRIIDDYYDEDSILWIVSDVTLKYLGTKLIHKRFVLHLMELSEKLVYYRKLPLITLDEMKIGNAAEAIVVPEYNRAHLTKVWWQLDELPLIVPNKPFIEMQMQTNLDIDNQYASKVIEEIGNRKIILYQGIISPERPLDLFIDVVDKLEGEYVFLIMSGGKNIYKHKKSKNYYFIPFINPPGHLQITSHAHIGVLSYVPISGTGYSQLNTLYCAPNKTFEYSLFGVPMIGNDIPGLRFLFETKQIGICFEKFTVDDICLAIKKIESNYNFYSKKSRDYYEECDYVENVKKVLDKCNNKNRKGSRRPVD